jgi:hypothetical protein
MAHQALVSSEAGRKPFLSQSWMKKSKGQVEVVHIMNSRSFWPFLCFS